MISQNQDTYSFVILVCMKNAERKNVERKNVEKNNIESSINAVLAYTIYMKV